MEEDDSEKIAKARREAESSAGYISKIIATINPELYADFKTSGDRKEFMKLRKTDFWKAVSKAAPNPAQQHKLAYDSSSETLEPVYFWIVDKMTEFELAPEKIVDNFSSSPGGGHFSELMSKATKMQEEGMKMMQTTGVLIKSLINIVYDLKEFEIRLSQYNSANSKDKNESEAGVLALKQIWMDNVDVKRGRGSINMLAQDLNFVTMRDAFMIAKDVQDVENMDLNDRVKRILKPRIQEFLKWKDLSGKELLKRYEIERTYLKSQLNALKLYTRWAKPYLRAAAQLEQKDYGRNPAMVNAFNTILFELVLFGKREAGLNSLVFAKKLPDSFRNKAMKRKFYQVVLVDFVFRGIPQRVGQNYVFGGRADVTFRAYSLNEDEINILYKKLDESDFKETLNLVQGMTDESLKELEEDLNYFLKKEDERKEKKTEEKETNPFSALFGMAETEGSKELKKKEKEVSILNLKPDEFIEKQVRAQAEALARKACFDLYDKYKKGHGMAAYPEPDWVPRDIGYPGKDFLEGLGYKIQP